MFETCLAFSPIPGGVDMWTFLLLGSLSVMLQGANKAGFAGGVGLMATPLMLYACGGQSRLALGIMLPMLIACDYAAMTRWWGNWEYHRLRALVPAAVVGVGLGSLTLYLLQMLESSGSGADVPAGKTLADLVLKLSIGVIALGFVGLQLLRWLRGRSVRLEPKTSTGLMVGTLAGFTSTLSHAAGPIVTMYLLPQGMPKGKYVATTLFYYWIGNQIKLVPYLLLGWLTRETLSANVILLPAVVVGALIGFFLHNRVNETLFRAIIYVFLGATGVHLTIRSLGELLQ